jgi:hypothetical protein
LLQISVYRDVRKLNQYTLVLLFLFLPALIFGQRNGRNYPHFEYKDLHFGAMLGTNTTTYSYEINEAGLLQDSIRHITLNRMPGLGIHVPVISWNPHAVFNIRLVPSISFHETEFSYSYVKNGKLKQISTRTQPTLLNFPVLLKLNTKRLNNFSAYAITGFSYSIDLASQRDVQQVSSNPILKLKRDDFAYHVGGGFDFYLPYFKFGIDIKITNGITDLLIQDRTFFSNPLNSLRSQCWWFSLTFEG